MPDAQGPLPMDELTSMPQPAPPSSVPMPLPSDNPVQLSQGQPQHPQSDDTPPGFVNPGQGTEDMDRDGDGALRPTRAGQISEDHQQRAAAGDGGFKLDAEAMRALQPEWEDIARELMDLRDMAVRLGNATPPAQDDASISQIKAVKNHAQACGKISTEMYKYADEYAKSISKAIGKTEAADQAAKDSARNAGRDV